MPACHLEPVEEARLQIGGLFSGTGALEAAASTVLDARLAWVAEHDPAAVKVLAHHHPTPNLGDVTAIDWASASPVDVLVGGYPCFIAGTLVLTDAGYKPIEKINVGDKVLTHRGRWRPVTSIMSRDNAELWTVKAGNTLTTTAEHPFYIRRQSRIWDNTARKYRRIQKRAEWVTAKDLEPRTQRIGQLLPPVEEPQERDPALWWLAGRYLADGYRQTRTKTGSGNPVANDQGKVVICCGAGKEAALRDKVTSAGLHAYEDKAGNVTKFVIGGQRLYRFTARFGSGAGEKSLPSDALALPKDYATDLLFGWLSGDGYREGNAWAGVTISKNLAFGLALLGQRALQTVPYLHLHVTAPTKMIQGRTVRQNPWWRITFPDHPRKNMIDGDWAWRIITDSKPTSKAGTVYNIAVSEDESYMADGAIVHNCQPVSQAGFRRGKADERWLWPAYRDAIRTLRPQWAVGENVAGHVTLGLRDVVADLQRDGYAVAWTTVTASSIGACHQRSRVFWLAWPEQHGAPAMRGDPVAWLARDGWGVEDLFGWTPVADWPRHGTAYGGCVCRSADLIQALEGTLLPTPRASDVFGPGRHGDGGADLRTTIAALLPTPTARDRKGRNQRDDASCLAGALLPTLTAKLGEVAATRLAEGRRNLDDAIALLLPTPCASNPNDSEDLASWEARRRRNLAKGINGNGQGLTLSIAVRQLQPAPLLPTPRATDAAKGGPNQRGSRGDVMLPAAVQPERWGRYAAAVARHESMLGRPAPDPTGPYGRHGEQRLSPKFVEWMMCWPDGWVTDVPSVTRTEAIRVCGNGVVIPQAQAALRHLLTLAPTEPPDQKDTCLAPGQHH
jgi:site-specific DNA-cytosine methylase